MSAPDDARSFYIRPRKSRLRTGSWQAVETATAAGLLDETQWVELKEDVPPSSKPANLELARDLASLSVGGGVLVIGVEDQQRKATAVVGAALDGLQDRISQVSQATISPPLAVTFDGPYVRPDEPSRGVLIVVVPPSPGAPHMVDQRYWGRSPNGKRPLPDDEVRLLLEYRTKSNEGFEIRLERLVRELDPSPDRDTVNSHLYLLAEPAIRPTPSPLPDDLSAVGLAAAVGFRPVQPPVLLSPGMRDRSHSDGQMFTGSSQLRV